jgi:hypothetical protein
MESLRDRFCFYDMSRVSHRSRVAHPVLNGGAFTPHNFRLH